VPGQLVEQAAEHVARRALRGEVPEPQAESREHPWGDAPPQLGDRLGLVREAPFDELAHADVLETAAKRLHPLNQLQVAGLRVQLRRQRAERVALSDGRPLVRMPRLEGRVLPAAARPPFDQNRDARLRREVLTQRRHEHVGAFGRHDVDEARQLTVRHHFSHPWVPERMTPDLPASRPGRKSRSPRAGSCG
jgi:hypothetical protein